MGGGTPSRPRCDDGLTEGPRARGVQQFSTAVEQPPHLVCAVPLIAAMGTTRDKYFTGGVWREVHNDDLGRLGFGDMTKLHGLGRIGWRIAENASVKPEKVTVPMRKMALMVAVS
ncbi:MAG: hypothetical protein AAB295_10815, partial [Chloroflexota bacterium]